MLHKTNLQNKQPPSICVLLRIKLHTGSHMHCFCTCASFYPSFRQMSGQITSTPVLLSTLILNNNSEGFHSDISIALQTVIYLCIIFQHLTQEEYKKF